MKTFLIFFCLSLTILLSFLTYFFDYIPEIEKTVQLIAWIFTFLSIAIAIFILFFYIRTIRFSKRQKKIYLIVTIFIMLLFSGFKIIMFSFSAGVDAMWSNKLLVKVSLPDLNEDLYVYSYSAFPDPGENIDIKRRKGWLPVMESIFEAKNFDYTGFKKEIRSVMFLSSSGKNLIYSYDSHKIESE